MIGRLVIACLLWLSAYALKAQQQFVAEGDAFIAGLLEQMTLAEKVGQMTNIGLTALTEGAFWDQADTLRFDRQRMEHLLLQYHVGSVQNKGIYPPDVAEWRRLTDTIGRFVADNSRLHIPVLFGIDAVHGANYTAGSTIFPHQLGIAATWNPALAEAVAHATALEMAASGLHWNYAPNADISRQPLWGRIVETFGSDALLTSRMAVAMVQGMQGEQLTGASTGIACLKHFVGYGQPYSGKDRSPALIPDRDLYQYYLPPFRAAIEAGAMTVMLNSGSVNGIPGHIDSALITGILKGEWGFEGFTISDWDDISKLVDVHRVATDYKDAVRQAVLAGMDMCMVPYDASFSQALLELVQEGKVPLNRIDDAVTRILRVKHRMGLFGDREIPAATIVGEPAHRQLAYTAALESFVLLKNSGQVLPLNTSQRILLTGPSSHSQNALYGPWSRTWAGVDTSYNDAGIPTIAEHLQQTGYPVTWVPCRGYDSLPDFTAFAAAADASDIILLCLGEEPATEKASDIASLQLPEAQQELVRMAHATGKPVIVVFFQGRPRTIDRIVDKIDAMVMGFYPGEGGAAALTDLLSGAANFSGKLPYTWPAHDGELIAYPLKGADLLDRSFGMSGYPPLFPFGHGLSYTRFAFTPPTISDTVLVAGDELVVSATVSNQGAVDGDVVVQWYLQDEVASVSPDLLQLTDFTKIRLTAGASATVSLTLQEEDLRFVQRNLQWQSESGYFTVWVGESPQSLQSVRFYFDKQSAQPVYERESRTGRVEGTR